MKKKETKQPKTEPAKKPETKPVMPMTAAFMAQQNSTPFETRYRGKRVRQSKNKSRAIQRREKRLNKIGWSLMFFTGDRHQPPVPRRRK